MDWSGFEIVRSDILRDEHTGCRLHIDHLKNGMKRYVVVVPKRDGIDQHIVFDEPEWGKT